MKQQQYNVGIYVRLSKDDERAGESLSIENQKMILRKYVEEQNWNLIDVYVDDGYSGVSFERPAIVCLTASMAAALPAQPRTAHTYAMSLSFLNSNAYCEVSISGAIGTTRIDNVTIWLMDSSGREVARWENLFANGTRFDFSRIASPVYRPRTHTLYFTAVVHTNGVASPINGAITRTYV